MNKIRIVTFNVRYADADDGINSWKNRKDLLISNIKENSPDIIGYQELLPHVKDFLAEELDDYIIVGSSRSSELDGESNSIAYRKDIFEAIYYKTIWLSPSPCLPGSYFEGYDGCPRIATALSLFDKRTNKIINIVNTHLDHMYAPIRIEQIKVLARVFKKLEARSKYPVATVLLGDFNCSPDSQEIAMVKEFEGGLQDISTSEMIDSPITYHGYFYSEEGMGKIDYIFANDLLESDRVYVDKSSKDGVYPSDHYPIYADLYIK